MTCKEYFKSLPVRERKKVYQLDAFLVEVKNVRGSVIIPFHLGIDDGERFPNIHELKILPEYFEALVDECKHFELRKDDRDYQVGDILALEEWDGEKFTGYFEQRRITYILRSCPEYGLADGYCILGF